MNLLLLLANLAPKFTASIKQLIGTSKLKEIALIFCPKMPLSSATIATNNHPTKTNQPQATQELLGEWISSFTKNTNKI